MSKKQEPASELELQESQMSVTPNEIRNAEFASAMRGFNREEVDEFMQKVATALEDTLAETVELRAQHELLQKEYEKLASMEDALKTTLLEAQKTADTIRANAERDVQLALERARGKQELVEEQTRERIARLQEKVRKLDEVRLDYRDNIQQTITSHLKILEDLSFTAELPEDMTDTYIEDNVSDSNVALNDAPSDSEQAEIEEVTLFESTPAEVEEVAQSETEPGSSESQPVGSLHSDLTDLADKTPGQEREQSSSGESHSAAEAIAQAVVDKSPGEQSKDDTLYKKLATDAGETSEPESASTVSATEEQSADANEQKASQPLEKGPDGIVVFGRKEDRDKAVEENARILSDLDSVVDKFAEDLREVDSK